MESGKMVMRKDFVRKKNGDRHSILQSKGVKS